MNVGRALRPARASWRLALPLALAVIGALGAQGPAAAQDQITGTVEAGSVDNEVTIVVVNPSDKVAVEGLQVSLPGAPRFLTNIRISPRSVASLRPKQSQRVVVTFNVSEQAPPRQTENMTFLISAENAVIRPANPTVAVTVSPLKAPVTASVRPKPAEPARPKPAEPAKPAQYFVYYHAKEFTCCKEGNAPEAPHPVRLGPVKEWEPDLRRLAGPFASADEAKTWLCGNHRVSPHYWATNWATVGGVTVTRLPCPITR